jgi:hypothetical protein
LGVCGNLPESIDPNGGGILVGEDFAKQENCGCMEDMKSTLEIVVRLFGVFQLKSRVCYIFENRQ